jgi:hypothetical protein
MNIKSRNLKLWIGVWYLIIIYALFRYNQGNLLNKDLYRFLFCYIFALFGVFIRAFIYFGIFKRDEDKILDKQTITDTIFNYFMYGVTSLAVVSIIYLISFDAFQRLDDTVFYFLSFFLFSYSGFAIEEVRRHFLAKEKN